MKALLLVLLVVPLIFLTGCLKDDADGSALFPAGPATGSGGVGACSTPFAGGTASIPGNCPTTSGNYTRYEYVVNNSNATITVNQFFCNELSSWVPQNRAEFEDYSNGPIEDFGLEDDCISATVNRGNVTSKLLFIREP